MSVNSAERNRFKDGALDNAIYLGDRGFKSRRNDARVPAVVLGGTGPGTLGLVRSLGQADVPLVLLDESAFTPAMRSRYGHKVVISRTRGESLVSDLLALGPTIAGPALLFPNSDDAVLTVSQYRAELEKHFLLRLPSHACITSLIHKTSFQRLAETHGFPVPRSVTIGHVADLSQLADLSFPCIVKPTRGTAAYFNSRFAKAYKVTSAGEAETVCRRILAVVPDLIVQEWIEGTESDLYFCLQYRSAAGEVVSSFTGRKLSIWPPDVGVTASCTAAPDAHRILQPLTEAFFERVSFIGMGGIEFKRNSRTGQFLMIEPTVGRVDGQEEVATLHGVNIPLAAYLHESGSPITQAKAQTSPVVWRDFLSDWKSVRGKRSLQTATPNAKFCDAYWRLADPMPALFHFLAESGKSLQRVVKRGALLPGRWSKSLRKAVHREGKKV